MVLTRPVTKTKISTTDFGQPVYDWIVANTPTVWTNVTFQNGWANFGGSQPPCQYRKTGDMVSVRGVIKSGTQGVAIFVLPAGFRPIYYVRFPISAALGTAGGLPYAMVEPSGAVSVGDMASTANVSLTLEFSIL